MGRSGVCEASGLGDLFWWWYVVVGAGQQESEEGERKQEREDQRPTDSRKKEALRARGLRLGGLNPPTGSRAAQPTPLSTGLVSGYRVGEWCGIGHLDGHWDVCGLGMG